MRSLSQVLSSLNSWAVKHIPLPQTERVHSIEPGDEVFLKAWNKEALEPGWKGPFTVLITTATVV